MNEWEYKVLILVPKERGDTLLDMTECHERQLGNLGPRGWELVSVVGRVAYLRRPVPMACEPIVVSGFTVPDFEALARQVNATLADHEEATSDDP